jgi:hypothetical protein
MLGSYNATFGKCHLIKFILEEGLVKMFRISRCQLCCVVAVRFGMAEFEFVWVIQSGLARILPGPLSLSLSLSFSLSYSGHVYRLFIPLC